MARSESLGEFRTFDRIAYRNRVMDGLTEAAVALFLLAVALVLPHGVFAAVVCLFPIALIPVLRRARKRWADPRIGYVEPMADKPREILPGIGLFMLVLLAAAIVLALILRGAGGSYSVAQRLHAWEPALAGFGVAGGMWYTASRSGLRRFYAYAVVSGLLGLALAAGSDLGFVAGRRTGLQWYLLAMGLLLAAGGTIVFSRFLRRHPVAHLEENGGQR